MASEFQRQIDDTVYALEGLEQGDIAIVDIYNRIKDYDPVVIYFLFRFLREKYPSTNPSASGVMSRMLELTSTYSDLVKKAQAGEKDVLREWFDEGYSMREFFPQPEEFFALLYEKLEG